MNIGIIFYSGTGINAFVASEIGKRFREQGHQVKVIRWTEIEASQLEQFDLLGVGAPCISFYAPRTFIRFLRRLPRGNTPFFLFSAYHGLQGYTIFSMYRVMKNRGYRYTGVKLEVTGIMSIRAWRRRFGRGTPMHTLYGLDRIGGLTDKLQSYVTVPQDSRPVFREKGNVLWDLFAALFAWPWQMAWVEGYFKRADKEKCTRCGLCWRVICPSGAIIQGKDKRPRFRWWKCEGCSGCVNICPEGAIYTLLNRNRQPCDGYASYILKKR